MPFRTFAHTTAATLLAAFLAPAAFAQVPDERGSRYTVSANAGRARLDVSGTSSAPLLAVRFDRHLGPRVLLAEGSFGTVNAMDSRRYLITDAQVQLQVPRAVAPYLGVGAGVLSRLTGATSPEHDVTMSVAAGLRLWQVLPRAVLRAEFRARRIGADFTGSIVEWTGGVGWAF